MKKIIFILVLLILPFNVVFASSGALKGDSIVSCNGNYYGKHGKDNHWHVAEKKSGRWYPQGSAIYSNPCGVTTKKTSFITTTVLSTTTTKVLTSSVHQYGSLENISEDDELTLGDLVVTAGLISGGVWVVKKKNNL